MIDEFPIKIEIYQTVARPETKYIFKVDRYNILNRNKAKLFHTTVARVFVSWKRARPDIQPIIVVLCTIVKQPNQEDWKKILRLMKYIVGTHELCITLKSYKTSCLKCLKLHKNAILTMEKVAIVSVSGKKTEHLKQQGSHVSKRGWYVKSNIMDQAFYRRKRYKVEHFLNIKVIKVLSYYRVTQKKFD